MYSFAVTTPRSVIFNENIFSFVHDDVLPVEADDLEDGLVLALWNGLAFYVGLEISALIVFKEFYHAFSSNVTFKSIFRYISSRWIHNPNLGECTSHTNIVGKPFVKTIFNTRLRHQDLTLEFFFNLIQRVQSPSALITIINKHKEAVLSASEDQLGGLGIEFHYSGNAVVLDELFYGVHLKFTLEIVSSLIELLEKDDSYSFDTVFGGEVGTVDVVEDEVVKCLSKFLPNTEFLRVLSTKEHTDGIIISLRLFNRLRVFKLSRGRLRLLS